jgi:hypothetical protein
MCDMLAVSVPSLLCNLFKNIIKDYTNVKVITQPKNNQKSVLKYGCAYQSQLEPMQRLISR